MVWWEKTIIKDRRIGATLTGPFPVTESSMALHYKGDGYYFGGCLPSRCTYDNLAVTADRLYVVPIPTLPGIADRIAIIVLTLDAGNTLKRFFNKSESPEPADNPTVA